MNVWNQRSQPPTTGTDLGLLVLRLALATVFGLHGYGNLFGGQHDRMVALLLTASIPGADVMAWAGGIAEFGGSVLLALGLATRLTAAVLAADMAVAIVKVRAPQGFLGAWEFEFTLLCGALALILAGAGKISLDTLVRARRRARRRLGAGIPRRA